MPSILRYGILLSIIISITLIFTQVEYGHGAAYFIEYIYDTETGNLIERRMVYDANPPTTTAYPPGGFYNAPQTVALLCSDSRGLRV